MVVEHNVHTAFHDFITALVGLFRGRVEFVNLYKITRDQLAVNLVQDAVDQFEFVENISSPENMSLKIFIAKNWRPGAREQRYRPEAKRNQTWNTIMSRNLFDLFYCLIAKRLNKTVLQEIYWNIAI